MKTPPPRAQGGPAILAALRDAIASGQLAPGAVLRQAELAEQFGTSRIPVREALNSLQAEGLVQIEPNRGAFVTTLSAQELHELFDLRVLVEDESYAWLRPLSALIVRMDDEEAEAVTAEEVRALLRPDSTGTPLQQRYAWPMVAQSFEAYLLEAATGESATAVASGARAAVS